ncbi:Peptidase M12B ADAM/reprolysin [Penicillium argentinense]|uniref:Peptidase M12B ADAM/reprolysin n=1 Tax=Penicillium argentinense TaxID=1131581 RepID=A0A9W9G5N7_9EURO|nr:Peptidase M12B ADAM/reprolysin [Penicillium argentinense]KAJ5112145.1 Peptidase M12B ADAM/reprolysin [Penicillium argentinense]
MASILATFLSIAKIALASATIFSPFQLSNPTISFVSNDASHGWATGINLFNITVGIGQDDPQLSFILEKNHDLISPDAHIQYIGSSKNAQNIHFPDYILTKGAVWIQERKGKPWKEAGWARLAVIQTAENLLFDGTFTLKSGQYEIQIQSNGNGRTGMVAHQVEQAFSMNDQILDRTICATRPAFSFENRQEQAYNPTNLIGNTSGCPKIRMTAYIGLVTDCSYTSSFNSTDAVHRYLLNVVNTASIVFENSFNISLTVQNLTISDTECPSDGPGSSAWNAPCSTGDLNSRLEDFSQWRSTLYDNNAYWTLFSGCAAPSGEVGVSWVGALCTEGSGSGSGANVVGRAQTEWQVFA